MKTFIIIILTSITFFTSCQKKVDDPPAKEEKEELSKEILTKRNEYANSYRTPNKIGDSLQARRNRNLFYHTCANGYGDQTGGAEGLAASANVEKLSLQGGNIKSWWMGAYYYDSSVVVNGLPKQMWVQWGYAVDGGGLFPAFYVYEIYPNYRYIGTLTIINVNQNVPLKYGTRVRFEIKHNTNTDEVPTNTYWSFLRDGQKVYDVDLGVTSFDGTLQSCTESWGSSSFSTLVHVDYFDFYRDGVWTHLPSAGIASIDAWNVVATRQRAEFKQSEHEFGGRVPSPILDYGLW